MAHADARGLAGRRFGRAGRGRSYVAERELDGPPRRRLLLVSGVGFLPRVLQLLRDRHTLPRLHLRARKQHVLQEGHGPRRARKQLLYLGREADGGDGVFHRPARLGHPLVRQPRPELLRDGLPGGACVPGLYLGPGGHSGANRQVLAQEHHAGERLQQLLRLRRSAATTMEGPRGPDKPQSTCSALKPLPCGYASECPL